MTASSSKWGVDHRWRLVILGSPEGRYARALGEAAERQGNCEVSIQEFEGLTSSIVNGHASIRTGDGVELLDCDAVLVRTMPAGTLEQVVFRIDLLQQLERAGVLVRNSSRSLEMAIDKHLTTARLHEAGLPVPDTVVCQRVSEALDAFERLGRDVVLKPIFGGEGRGLMRLQDIELAARAFKTLAQLGAVFYLQRFIRHPGYDLRILCLGDRQWCIRRESDDDWRCNVSRGGRATACEIQPAWSELARRAAETVGAWFAGIDLVLDERGEPWVLEVNAVPGWEGLAAAHGFNVASEVILTLRHEWEQLARVR